MTHTTPAFKANLFQPAPSMLAMALGLLVMAGAASAATINFPTLPLFLSQSDVKPNMLVAIDDSGSMAEETLLLSNDGAAWWHAQNANGDDATVCTTGFTGCGTDPATATNIASANTINFNYVGNGSAAWRKYGYLIPTGDESFYSIPPIGQFAYYRSSFYNPGYFDVSKVYKPWTNYSTTVFADAVPAAAIFDPTTNSTTMDLTAYRASNVSLATASVAQPMTQTACTGLAPTYAAGYNFRAFAGMVLPQGTCYRPSGGNWTFVSATSYTVPANNNNGVDQGTAIAVLYFPATFYLPKNVALPAGYGYTGAPTTNGLAPDGVTQLYGYEIKPANFTNTAAYTLAMQNFANWFQYYRKRNLAVRGGFGAAFADVKRLRIGQYTINKRSFGNMLDMSTAADKNTLYSNVYGLTFGGGTPNKEAVGYMIDRYKATDSTAPITDACQQNFGVLFTDGFANASTVSVGGSAVGNTDGDQGSPFADKVSDTMADIVMYGYKNNIRPDLTPGLVPPEAMCSTDPTNPMLDCRKDPHMGFYAITLGGRGFTYGVNTVQTNDPYNNVPTWPTTFANRNPTAVDDLWHAAINGRGSLLLATTPQSIADKFKQILDSIVGKTGAASAVAANAGALSSGSRLYQARFNSADWSGTLSSLRLSTGSTGACPTVAVGNPCPVNSTAGDWEAGNVLNNKAATSRSIITLRDSDRSPVPFRWANLSTTQQALLNIDPATITADTNGSKRVDYLRGDQSQEATTATPRFRARTTKLGDIIDSDPYFVGAPLGNYGFNGYPSFRTNKASRTPMIYVAANDGMLHGFRSDTGEELLAYIPSKAYGPATGPKLTSLSNPGYSHVFINDGTPTVGDVYTGGSWKSLLVGTLRAGGQGVYALDVTDPTTFSESNAANIVQWEFTDADDADLGYTFSQPSVVRMQDGNWYVLFSSGYNNTEADGKVSTTGTGALYLLKASGPTGSNHSWVAGTDFYKITIPSGSLTDASGVGTPAAVDVDNDNKIDYLYVGDLAGNLWRTTVTGSTPASWTTTSKTVALFKAVDPLNTSIAQPITMQPEVGFNKLTSDPNDLIVYFGTGRYIDSSDATVPAAPKTQTFYAIVDSLAATPTTINRSNAGLVQQTVLQEVGSASTTCTTNDCYRVTSQNSVPSTATGWYINLYNTNNGAVTDSLAETSGKNAGERSVLKPVLRNGRILLTTLIPNASRCSFGGSGWVMELDAKTGARLATATSDTNNNGKIDDSDKVGAAGNKVVSSGTRQNGIIGGVGIISIGYASSGVLTTTGTSTDPNQQVCQGANCGGLEKRCFPLSTGDLVCGLASAGFRYGRISWREIIPQ